jgi:hypothetical protein
MKRGSQLRIGVLRACEFPARQKGRQVHGSESLSETVDMYVRVFLFALEGGAEQLGAFLPSSLGAAQEHALRSIEQHMNFRSVDRAVRQGDEYGIQADG